MIEVKSIREHTGGTWIVQYETWAPCLCSFARKSIIIHQTKKPTYKQILTKIEDENNIKG